MMKLVELRQKYKSELDSAAHKMNHLYKENHSKESRHLFAAELKEFIIDRRSHIEIIDATINDLEEIKNSLK